MGSDPKRAETMHDTQRRVYVARGALPAETFSVEIIVVSSPRGGGGREGRVNGDGTVEDEWNAWNAWREGGVNAQGKDEDG